jgi:CRISPR-associated protein Csy1
MTTISNQRQTEIRRLLSAFLEERLQSKLDKLTSDDPKRDELRQQFIPAHWLEDAARRAGQIQAVTHSLKPVHPDAKGTEILIPPIQLEPLNVVGSHCLANDFAVDYVCDSKLLPIVAFLKLEYEGKNLLTLAVTDDTDLALALSDDSAQGKIWLEAFATVTQARGRPTSHTLAKQLYWSIGNDPNDDASYHLLSPLYASSLAHRVFEVIKEDDYFNDPVKAARKAMNDNAYSERPVRSYLQLAIQQLGGSNTQNISHLNKKRRGENRLLASLPPKWRSADVKPLLHTDSIFPSFSRRPEVRASLKALLAFLKTDPQRNLATRNTRAAMVDELTDAFLQFTAELQTLEPGWSQTPQCRLSDAECRWLDPEGVAQTDIELHRPPPTDVAERISAAFANWLNGRLRDPLPMGDPEFLAWRKVMHAHIKAQEREGAHAD